MIMTEAAQLHGFRQTVWPAGQIIRVDVYQAAMTLLANHLIGGTPLLRHPAIDGNVKTNQPVQSRATVRAIPMPPPMHRVARPFLASRFCISCSRVIRTRAPDAPIGWPSAMAPPLTFTFDGSQPSSLLTAQAWAAKASFASIRSRSSTDQPAF